MTYPNDPGSNRQGGTSEEAAIKIKPIALTTRQKVYAYPLEQRATAVEVAEAIGKSILSVRPRVSELVHFNLVWDCGYTRENASGLHAKVWTGMPMKSHEKSRSQNINSGETISD